MNPMPKIKICGLREVETAQEIARMGAHYLGLIFHAASKRCVDIATAKAITLTMKDYKALPVGVFVEQDASSIIKICEETHLSMVQLHGRVAKQHVAYLPSYLSRIYVISVNEDGSLCEADLCGLEQLDPSRDFLLFDSVIPGSGKAFCWKTFFNHPKHTYLFRLHVPFFISGGVTSKNVTELLQYQYQNLFAIDIASGVEKSPGVKDLSLVQELLKTMKENFIYV